MTVSLDSRSEGNSATDGDGKTVCVSNTDNSKVISPGIHQPHSRHKTLGLAGASVILLFYVVSHYAVVFKATAQTQSSRGRRNRNVWSINLFLACCLIGTTHGSFVKKQSGQCSELTNGVQVKDFDDCGKGNAAVGWSGVTTNLANQYKNTFAGGCFYYGNWAKPLLNDNFASTAACSTFATCICWIGATCEKNTVGASVNPTDCMCGTKICDTDEGRFCLSSLNKCSKSVILDACAMTDGSAENSKNCACGLEDCTETTGRFCTLSLNSCSKAVPCSTTDGTVANTNDCTCGIADCDASTGRFCSSSINACYKAPCATLLLSASGSTTQSSRLGKYTWIGSNSGGRPAYKFGSLYLFWHPNGNWMIGPTLGSTSAFMYWSNGVLTPDLSSPSPTPIKAYSGIAWQNENIIIRLPLSCLPLCTNVDGSSANSNDCRCGTAACYATTHGRYCNSAENKCGGNCFTGSTFDVSIFVPETQTSKLSPGCKWSTVGTDWCVIETNRAKLGAHTLTRASCSFTSAMTIVAGTALQLTGDSSTATVFSGMKQTQFFVVNGQLTLVDLVFKEGKSSGNGGAFFSVFFWF